MDKELRDRLYWLEDELFEEEYAEFGANELDVEEIIQEFSEEAPPRRRFRSRRNYAPDLNRAVYDDEDFDEDAALLIADRKAAKKNKKKGKRGEKPPKRGDIKGLVFLAVLELTGIFAVLLWWLGWLI